MGATLSLIRREFGAYFVSPVAYVVMAGFLVVTGHFFYLALAQLTASGPKGIELPMQLMLGIYDVGGRHEGRYPKEFVVDHVRGYRRTP